MTSHIAHIRRVGLVGISAGLALLLAACSSSTAGSGTAAAGGGSSAATGASGSSSAGGSSDGGAGEAAASAADLASAITDGVSGIKTVHLSIATTGGSTASDAGSGEGDVQLASDGTPEAFTITVGSGDTGITQVLVDGTGYVKLPTSQLTDPSKPWAVVSDSSTIPIVKFLAAGFDSTKSQASLALYGTIVSKSSNFQATGASEVDGVSVQTYAFDIDPSSLPLPAGLGDLASTIGPIPATLAVDGKGRPVELVENISVSGTTTTSTVTLSKYDEDVDISAPSADEVASG